MIKEGKFDELVVLFEGIATIKRKEDIFDLTCKISKQMESLSRKDLLELASLNLHVKLIWNVFSSKIFIDKLNKIHSNFEKKKDSTDEKEIIQLLLRISFFVVSVLAPVLKNDTIFFLNQQFVRSIKALNKGLSSRISILNLIFMLEEINYDIKYRFEKNTLIELNTDFLNMNQISSRVLVGSLLMLDFGYLALPKLLREVVKSGGHPAQVFKVAYRASKKSRAYQNYEYLLNDRFFSSERKESVVTFLELLRDHNIENLILLINMVSVRYDSYDESMTQKIDFSSTIRGKIQDSFERMSVFTGSGIFVGDWSNKVFLNTVRFFAVLESVRYAKDKAWQKKTFAHFLSRWFVDLHEVINHHTTLVEEKIIVYVEGPSDKIILENAYKILHPNNSSLKFYDVGGKKELFKKLNATQVDDLGDMVFGLFDFDDAYNDFNGLNSNFSKISGASKESLYRTRVGKNKIFALLLPVPKDRKDIASLELKEKSLLSIELMFSDELLEQYSCLRKKQVPGGYVNVFSGNKIRFAQKTSDFNEGDFQYLIPLFDRIFKLMKGDEN